MVLTSSWQRYLFATFLFLKSLCLIGTHIVKFNLWTLRSLRAKKAKGEITGETEESEETVISHQKLINFSLHCRFSDDNGDATAKQWYHGNSLSSDWLKPDVSSVEYFCNLFSSHCRLIFLKKVDISIFATCCKVEQAGSSHWNQRNLSPLFVSFTYFGKTMFIYIGLCLISLCWCDSLVMPEVKIGQQCSSCPLRHSRATPPPNLGSKIIVPFVWRPCADHTMLIRPWDLWVVLGVALPPVAGHGINWRRRGVIIWLHG